MPVFIKVLCGQPRLWLALAVLFMLFPRISHGQQPPDTGLPAEQIIDILKGNPDLLAEAKKEIVSRLRDRGFSVTEADITDDRLFGEIQTDDRVRLAISNELKARGYGQEETEQEAAQPGQKPGAPEAGQAKGQAPMPAAKPPGTQAPARPEKPGEKPGADRSKESLQKFYLYRSLPALQDLYGQALIDVGKLERFGAALFRNSTATDKTATDVAVGSDYIIGSGDQLVVEYWGSVSQRLQLTVDRQGRVVLPEAGSVLVAGHTLDEATQLIRNALKSQYRDITVDVSLGKLRSVRVYVVGDVKNPGAYETSALATPLSALLSAGGPTDNGSMRTVRHMRGRKLIEEIDLYDLMLKGVTAAVERIESGDSILVPPVGPQVTVAGMVRRPAIYELRGEQTLDQVLDLAGGVPVTGELGTIKVERILAHERKVMLDINLPKGGDVKTLEDSFKKFAITDGDRVTVSPILPHTDQAVYLQGHVFRPGKYPYRQGIKVSDLIGSYADLLPEPSDRGEIVRLSPPDYSPSVISFNLRDVLEKRQDAPALQPFDTVRVFGRYEADAPKVAIYGEVLRPGEYPLSQHMTAADLVRLAGGFKRSAFTDSADLASYTVLDGNRVDLEHHEISIAHALAGDANSDVPLKPGDVLTVRQLGGWTNIGGAIRISGEVLHPGRYGIQDFERLSSVLKRAGGFLPEAYPYGAVLERDQVREIASKNRDEMIRKLQAQGLELDSSGKPESPAMARQRQALIDKLKQIEPSGRLLIHISPEIEKWEKTTADIEVRAGDTLIIPRKPNFVLVAGQVYSPTAITYSRGKHASWYLRQAGGATKLGSQKDVFVVRANGAVIGRTAGQWWSGNALNTVLQPGDTVFVPEKIAAGDKLKLFAESAQVLSGLAVAARVAISF